MSTNPYSGKRRTLSRLDIAKILLALGVCVVLKEMFEPDPLPVPPPPPIQSVGVQRSESAPAEREPELAVVESDQPQPRPIPETAELLIQETVAAVAENDATRVEELLDSLFRLEPDRDFNADILQEPRLGGPLRAAWSRTHLIVPFSLIREQDRLAANFSGTSFPDAYRYLASARAPLPRRAETETQAEYEARVQNLKAKALRIGPFNVDRDLFVFAGNLQSWMNYDPDTQAVRWGMFNDDKGKFQVSRNFSIFGDETANVVVSSYTEDGKRYFGSNAFGVTRQVQQTTTFRRVLSLENVNDLEWDKLSFPVRKEDWATLKPELMSLYVVRLSDQSAGVGIQQVAATLDSPTDSLSTSEVISGELVEYWVYRNDTGEVLSKVGRRQ